MKNLLFIALLFTFFPSCVSIYFLEPQPENGVHMEEVPQELWGEWKTEEGIITIDKRGFTTTNHAGDNVDSELLLSDTTMLFKIKGLYVLNTRELDSNWEIVILERNKTGDISSYQSTDTSYFVKDRNLKLEEAHFEIDGKDTVAYELDPHSVDPESEIKFTSATFSGQMRYRTIKKIINEDNLMFVLKADGTSYSPDPDRDDED